MSGSRRRGNLKNPPEVRSYITYSFYLDEDLLYDLKHTLYC